MSVFATLTVKAQACLSSSSSSSSSSRALVVWRAARSVWTLVGVPRPSRMFVSVWYAKKMGRQFINNVRKAKKQRQRIMVGDYAVLSFGFAGC